jgi:hypothetical protein
MSMVARFEGKLEELLLEEGSLFMGDSSPESSFVGDSGVSS